MRILDRKSLHNIVAGATFLGSGGGGSPVDGLKLVQKIFDVAKGINLVGSHEVPDNAYIGMIAGIGSPRVFKDKGFDVETIYVYEALERLYSLVGAKFSYLMPGELGGFNTITPMYAAAIKKLPMVDCDGNGRAVPELDVGLYPLFNIPATPIVLADRNGNVIVGYPNDPLDTITCESIARGFAVASGMSAAFATWTVNGRTMKECLALGSISRCEKIGEAARRSSREGRDPLKEVTSVVDGYELIRGTISDISTKTVAGFDFGRTVIEGTGPYADKKLFVDFKNENIIAWKEDDEPVAMAPDLICLMTNDGEPLTNADTKEGMKIGVIAVSAPEKVRSHPRGFTMWSSILEKLNYTGPYKPVKQLL